jgi:hypothetical protein
VAPLYPRNVGTSVPTGGGRSVGSVGLVRSDCGHGNVADRSYYNDLLQNPIGYFTFTHWSFAHSKYTAFIHWSFAHSKYTAFIHWSFAHSKYTAFIHWSFYFTH